ncbi:MAG: hypothetical protein IJ530_00420 [Treponema sp.]|uniref:hypothetical protein n=1 Tax=Treponema sp. TaxID=166 RepID=UPI0025F6EB3B|nr:hypothetical protein [Treponema sp.]MBQ8678210.1 hypothetical protein [Treponema sp.]
MFGIILNVILFSIGFLALVTGIAFLLQERENGYTALYVFFFSVTVALTCIGYSIMGFMPNLDYAFIPRLVGLFGIDSFLIVELSFLLFELKRRRGIRMFILGFLLIYLFFDLLIFGNPSALSYIRYEWHTSYENTNKGAHLFHYIFISVMIVILLFHGIYWYKSKKIQRDKVFSLEIILSNFILLVAAIPDTLNLDFSHKYPTFGYSAATAVVFFSYWFSVKSHIKFTPTVKNVSQEVFTSVEVPVIIFDLEGKINLSNPCAKSMLQITEDADSYLRSLFSLSDVETLHLLTRAKNGWKGAVKTIIKASGQACNLHCTIKKDNLGETFCVIGTVLVKN